MAIRSPQYDLLPDISGGDDAWDDGLAGELLSADYFAASTGPSTWTITPSGTVVFVGSAAITLQKNIVILPSGVIVFNGTAPITTGSGVSTWTIVPTGGITFAQTNLLSVGRVFLTSGGIVLQGSLAFLHGRTLPTVGNISFSGDTPTIKTKNYSPTGVLQFSGTAPITSNTVVAGALSTRLPLTFAGT